MPGQTRPLRPKRGKFLAFCRGKTAADGPSRVGDPHPMLSQPATRSGLTIGLIFEPFPSGERAPIPA